MTAPCRRGDPFESLLSAIMQRAIVDAINPRPELRFPALGWLASREGKSFAMAMGCYNRRFVRLLGAFSDATWPVVYDILTGITFLAEDCGVKGVTHERRRK